MSSGRELDGGRHHRRLEDVGRRVSGLASHLAGSLGLATEMLLFPNIEAHDSSGERNISSSHRRRHEALLWPALHAAASVIISRTARCSGPHCVRADRRERRTVGRQNRRNSAEMEFNRHSLLPRSGAAAEEEAITNLLIARVDGGTLRSGGKQRRPCTRTRQTGLQYIQ